MPSEKEETWAGRKCAQILIADMPESRRSLADYQAKHFLWQASGKVATVTLNRPKQLNAINRVMVRELDAVAADLEGDRAARVVIVTGGEWTAAYSGQPRSGQRPDGPRRSVGKPHLQGVPQL